MRRNVGNMLKCLAKISLPACGRRCVLELKKAVLGGQSGVQAVLRALRRFSSDFREFLVVFPRFSPDIGCRRAGSLVRGHRGRLPAAEMLETCWTLIALLNVASTVPTLWEILKLCADWYDDLSTPYACNSDVCPTPSHVSAPLNTYTFLK